MSGAIGGLVAAEMSAEAFQQQEIVNRAQASDSLAERRRVRQLALEMAVRVAHSSQDAKAIIAAAGEFEAWLLATDAT